MPTDKAISNTQEKRHEYLNSFLNTKLNTLTIQTMSPPFYCHIVKCTWTKCMPADTKGTEQKRVLGNTLSSHTDAHICIRTANSLIFFKWSDLFIFLFSSSDLCIERCYRQRKALSSAFKHNNNIKNKGTNSRRQGRLLYKLWSKFQAGTRSHREACSTVLLNEFANKISSHLAVISMRRQWKPNTIYTQDCMAPLWVVLWGY